MHKDTFQRHRTAINRSVVSRPIRLALEAQLVISSNSFFDYGCGRGDDVTSLAQLGYNVAGWDPVHRPDTPQKPSDLVNLGYVVNVIEDPHERAEALRSAWRLTGKV